MEHALRRPCLTMICPWVLPFASRRPHPIRTAEAPSSPMRKSRWFSERCGRMGDCCVPSRCSSMGYGCNRRLKLLLLRRMPAQPGVANCLKRNLSAELRARSCVRRWHATRAEARTSALTIPVATIWNSRSTRSAQQMAESGLKTYSSWLPSLCSGFGPAITDQTAQMVRMAPIVTREMVMEMSSQWSNSILNAMNASIAPRP